MSAAATERQPGLTAMVRDLMVTSAASDEATLDLVVDRVDGPQTFATVDLVPRRGAAVERSEGRREELLDRTAAEVGALMAGAAGDSGRIDVLGLLGHVARTPGPAHAVVVTSGLQSSGSLAVGTLGWDLVGSDTVLDQAEAEGLLPDLAGKAVVFSGLGEVAGAQQRLPERLRTRLASMWLGICERSGAVECRLDTEPVQAGTPVSTVPAPTVAVPEDPVLMVPAVAATPAVVELPGDVLFEPDSARLLPEAEALLASLAAQLPPGARVELAGRTASVGSAESSRVFSLERAVSCRDALVRAGVSADRITVVGLGFDQQLAPDLDVDGGLLPEAASRNRSVTMTIHIGGTP